MGLYDTIIFPRPIKCRECGEEHLSTQTKQFENIMREFKVGDFVETQVLTGIIEDDFLCEHKEKEGENLTKPYYTQNIYYVVWHRILVDVCETQEQAEQRLRTFGLGELYFLYEQLHGERNDFETKYRKLKHYSQIYVEYLNKSEAEKEKFLKGKNEIFRSFQEMDVAEAIKEGRVDPLKYLIDQLDQTKYPYKSLFD